LRIHAYVKSSPEKGLMYKKQDMFASLAILTQATLVTREIENPLLVIAHLLEKIL